MTQISYNSPLLIMGDSRVAKTKNCRSVGVICRAQPLTHPVPRARVTAIASKIDQGYRQSICSIKFETNTGIERVCLVVVEQVAEKSA